MKIVNLLSDIKYDINTYITIGTFDGIHLGHQRIIDELIYRTKNNNGRSLLITFDPHPREVVGRGPTKLLTTLKERTELLTEFNIDVIYVVNFTFEFSRLPYDEFYREYIYKCIGVKEVIVGYDHMFGRDREANIEQLVELGNNLGFKVDKIGPISANGEIVSSSKIRNILLRGDVCRASKFLGRYYSIDGKIVTGDNRGRLIGFPTANLQPLSENKLIPAEGVYFVSVKIGSEKYYGMLNIGIRPTFTTSSNCVIEFNLFNFDKEIYNETVRVYFHKRIRSEKKFSSKEELIRQLKLDKLECEEYIKKLIIK